MDIAVIGSEEFVLGFRLAGLRHVFVATPENYQEVLLKAMEDENVGILAAERISICLRPTSGTRYWTPSSPSLFPWAEVKLTFVRR